MGCIARRPSLPPLVLVRFTPRSRYAHRNIPHRCNDVARLRVVCIPTSQDASVRAGGDIDITGRSSLPRMSISPTACFEVTANQKQGATTNISSSSRLSHHRSFASFSTSSVPLTPVLHHPLSVSSPGNDKTTHPPQPQSSPPSQPSHSPRSTRPSGSTPSRPARLKAARSSSGAPPSLVMPMRVPSR